MTRRWRRTVALALVLMAAASTGASQTVALNRVMREKLTHSQNLLAAVVMSRWRQAEEQSQALRRLTDEPSWSVLRSPEYVQYTQRFVRALDDLVEAAKRKDLDLTPVAYTTMVTTCVQCHRYIARMRLADVAPRAGAVVR